MKKFLSLALALAVSSLTLVSLIAQPVRAQHVASAGKSIGEIKEEYERLLAIDRDPSTPAEVRAMNRNFLDERRTRLRDMIMARIDGLHKYQSSAASMLTEKERVVLDQSIRDLETQLQSLQSDAQKGAPTPEPAATQPAATTRKAKATRPMRAAKDSATLLKASATSGAAQPMSKSEPAPDASPTTKAAPEPKAASRPDDPPAAIVISAPADGAKFIVDKIELEVTVNDDDINNVDVSIFEGDGTKLLATRSNQDILRSDRGKKKFPVSLRKGVNRIEVTSKQKPDAKAVAKVTYASDEPVAIGSSGAGGGAPAPPPTTFNATPNEKWTNVPVAGQNVRVGHSGESGKLYQFSATKKNGSAVAPVSPTTPTGPGVNGTVTAIFSELDAGDMITVVEMDSGNPVAGTFDSIKVESPLDPTKGGPIGLLVGGVVMSQQSQEFGQSDPFFGFIAGYSFKVKRAYLRTKCGDNSVWVMDDGSLTDDRGFTVLCDKNDHTLRYKRKDGIFVAKDDVSEFVRSTSNRKKNGGFLATRKNLRFQGIFQADPRRAEATETATTEGGTPPPNEPFKFIASRKTFDVDMHGWIDFWANNNFTIGPYFAIGASTVLDKNELQGEAVTESTDTAGDTTDNTVATNARSDNDIKKYYEFGLLSNTNLLDGGLFIQSILAYGNYEALSGLYDGDCWACDTKHRFVGKLRVWPSGLSRGFGRQIQAAPMFGVDLNAGRGPDHLKFFTGFAVRIRGINTN